MASIIENLQAILSARYGRDVRNAIHDSISDLNEIANTAQTSAKAYYEGTQALAQTISGNVGIDDSAATLSTTYSSHKIENKTRTNLSNPTLGTTTVNGVTVTDNGNGTYTLSGTATSHADIRVTPWGTSEYANLIQLEPNKKYKIIGSPSGSSASTYFMCVVSNNGTTRNNIAWDYNNDGVFTSLDSAYHYEIKISVTNGTTLPSGGITFKPMVTTDLSATYDDYVAYSGNGELNANVADLYKEIQNLKNVITELGGTI